MHFTKTEYEVDESNGTLHVVLGLSKQSSIDITVQVTTTNLTTGT